MRSVAIAAVLSILSLASNAGAEEKSPYSAANVENLLEAGDVDDAIATLDARLRKVPKDSRALLLRSTAFLMRGDLATGRRDLQTALSLDPELRQGWLNLGALDMAEGDHRGALGAFIRAEELDPQAGDNSLNIGAALLFAGEREAASQRFRRYLEAHGEQAEPYFLVAVNYALADRQDLALPLLRRAVHLDERIRLRIRTDPSFARMVEKEEFLDLLETDGYRPPLEALVATRSFDVPFTGRDSPVLEAVLSALQLAGSPFETAVEVTPSWALVWSDVRIKVAAGDASSTVVTVSSLDSTRRADWSTSVADLFQRISVLLYSQRPREPRPPSP